MKMDGSVRDVMTREVKVLHRNDCVEIAEELMKMERIRHLPVLDEDDRVVGLLSQSDMFRSALARCLGYGEHAQDILMAKLVIKDVMTNDPVTVEPATSLAEAAGLMLEHKIGCLPVVENDLLVGTLTESDLLKLFVSGG